MFTLPRTRHLNSQAHLNSIGSSAQLNCSFRFSCYDKQNTRKEQIVLCCSFPSMSLWTNDYVLQLKGENHGKEMWEGTRFIRLSTNRFASRCRLSFVERVSMQSYFSLQLMHVWWWKLGWFLNITLSSFFNSI